MHFSYEQMINRKEKRQHSDSQQSTVWYSIDSVDSCGIADNLMQSQDGMVIMSTRGADSSSLIQDSDEMCGSRNKGFTNQEVCGYNEYMRQGRLKSLFTNQSLQSLRKKDAY